MKRQFDPNSPDSEQYEDSFQSALQPILYSLYEDGVSLLTQIPTNASEAEISAYLYPLLLVSGASIQLLSVLRENMIDGFELAGQDSLDRLEIDATFSLTNEDLIDQIDGRAREVRNIMVQTTADDIAAQAQKHRDAGINNIVFIGFLILSWATTRTLLRANWAAMNEGVWATRFGQLETLGRNGVAEVMFVTARDEKVDGGDLDGPCAIRDGLIFPVNDIPVADRIPQHIGCRCYWVPILDGWVIPGAIWFGGS